MSKYYHNKKQLVDQLIKPGEAVLDVGFWGQGVSINDINWVHNLLKSRTSEVYGIDLEFDASQLSDPSRYRQTSAENFDFDVKFDVIFAGDLIEHLSNPGLFLAVCARNLKNNGRLIITTPNCFNFFNLTEKISKSEPTVNKDHTCYFNIKTLRQLLEKNNWEVKDYSFLYSLEVKYQESWKKKILNVLYRLLSKVTNKFMVDLVVKKKKKSR